jgi:tRNA threonylcarbamoyladenosine modification (KEOPS) complex Cgi121 subunit
MSNTRFLVFDKDGKVRKEVDLELTEEELEECKTGVPEKLRDQVEIADLEHKNRIN